MKKILSFFVLLTFLVGCMGPTALELEEKRIADSIRAADSIMMINVEKMKLESSISGLWTMSYYVDEFGNPTKKNVITHSEPIYGVFSNSATQDSPLTVQFLIDGPEKISIKLFEYAGDNPVKSGMETGYKIKVKPPDTEAITLQARNYGDRLTINKSDSRKLTDIFIKGGKIQFYIIDITDYSHSTYNFEIENSRGIEKLLSEL